MNIHVRCLLILTLLSAAVVLGAEENHSPKSKEKMQRYASVYAAIAAYVFAGQVQYQAGAYADTDGNGVGEYGYLSYLAGVHVDPASTIDPGSLLLVSQDMAKPNADGLHEKKNYVLKVYLNNGQGVGIDRKQFEQLSVEERRASAKQRELQFIVYAWPRKPEFGDLIFAMDQTAQVYMKKGNTEPKWDARFDTSSKPVFGNLSKDGSWQPVNRQVLRHWKEVNDPAHVRKEKDPHKRDLLRCANSLKQIMTMCIKHRVDTREVWPNPWKAAGYSFPEVKNSKQAKEVTACMFEYLAMKHRLKPALFFDPRDPDRAPASADRSAKEIVEKPDLSYASFYALDWSAPKTAGTIRPTLAMRFPIRLKFAVVYADSHLGSIDDFKLQIEEFAPAHDLHTVQGESRYFLIGGFDGTDDIFSGEGDGPGIFTYGRGHRKRAFMK